MPHNPPQTKSFGRRALMPLAALALSAGAISMPLVPVYAADPVKAIAPQGGPASFSPVVKAVAPAVVHIEVTQRASNAAQPTPDQIPPGMREFFEKFFGDRLPGGGRRGPQRPRTGLGSGFFIDADGHIVTNNHVIAGADQIVVTMKDGQKLDAKLIGADSRTDLALLKVEGDAPFPFVGWGDSDKAEVGDWIVAVGNPFGLDHTVTTGIVSARGRSIGAGPYDDFLQIDAPINKGNSGGPAFNLSGQVVGVNTAIFSPTGGSVGIGFAIPSNLAKNVIGQLKDGGVVRRGWLGVAIQNVTPDIASSLGLDGPKGAIVSNVTPDGPADDAGLQAGDVILEVNGEAIEEMPELPRVIAAIPPSKTAKIVVWRNGAERTIDVKLGALPDEATLAGADTNAPSADTEALGLTLAPLTDAARKAARVDEDVAGVLVTAVDDASPLAAKGVEPGAVILEVGGSAVATPAEAKAAIEKAEQGGKKAVLLLIRQNRADRFVAAPLAQG